VLRPAAVVRWVPSVLTVGAQALTVGAQASSGCQSTA